jgi:gluconolactonase
MTITRRNLLAGAGAAAASALLARATGAQSFPFTPNQRDGNLWCGRGCNGAV